MRQTRTVQGCYANWTVTVTTEPPDGEVEAVEIPTSMMTSIGDCFRMAVNCYELSRDADRLARRMH